ncbi:MAG: GTPase Era [Gemmatimonadetes bacterium]|nr:GTPase Era [Gemmatimonadota bacterium]
MSEAPGRAEGAGSTRAGYVALVGRPNVGKSTLLNGLTGEKLSIVTPRAQTTRERVMGLYSDEAAQLVFVDTPGLLEPQYLLQESMVQAALAAAQESDVVLLLLDALRPEDTLPDPRTLELLRRRSPLLLAINKVDAARPEAVGRLLDWGRRELGREAFLVSAARGDGLAELRRALIEALPASPFLYPPDEVAVQPVRFFVAELVRETIFEEYEEEIPYSTVVRIEEFREASDPLYVRATIFVERPSQKAIVIGRQGTGIRKLGQRARRKIEEFLSRRIYLDLWVKPLPRWRHKPSALRYLGYPVPTRTPQGEV